MLDITHCIFLYVQSAYVVAYYVRHASAQCNILCHKNRQITIDHNDFGKINGQATYSMKEKNKSRVSYSLLWPSRDPKRHQTRAQHVSLLVGKSKSRTKMACPSTFALVRTSGILMRPVMSVCESAIDIRVPDAEMATLEVVA